MQNEVKMVPDAKWLEILKATGWQTAAIAIACGLFLLATSYGWLPPLVPWVLLIVAFALLVSGCLAIASFFSALFRFLPAHAWLARGVNNLRERRAVANYIPHMTTHDREIIAYLLDKNQKMFTCAADGGYAVTLLARGIVVKATQRGQMYDLEDIPMAIPDNVWKVLQQHKDQLPYKRPHDDDEVEPHRWRVPWQLR